MYITSHRKHKHIHNNRSREKSVILCMEISLSFPNKQNVKVLHLHISSPCPRELGAWPAPPLPWSAPVHDLITALFAKSSINILNRFRDCQAQLGTFCYCKKWMTRPFGKCRETSAENSTSALRVAFWIARCSAGQITGLFKAAGSFFKSFKKKKKSCYLIHLISENAE